MLVTTNNRLQYGCMRAITISRFTVIVTTNRVSCVRDILPKRIIVRGHVPFCLPAGTHLADSKKLCIRKTEMVLKLVELFDTYNVKLI